MLVFAIGAWRVGESSRRMWAMLPLNHSFWLLNLSKRVPSPQSKPHCVLALCGCRVARPEVSAWNSRWNEVGEDFLCVTWVQIADPHLRWPPGVERQVTGRLVCKHTGLEPKVAEVKENLRQPPWSQWRIYSRSSSPDLLQVSWY